MKAPIGQSELEFVFEIGNGPKPANDRHRFFLAGEFDQKTTKGGDLNSGGPGFVRNTVL